MNFKDLNILLTIYEQKSISKASNELYISQPAITYRLKKMEKELGIQILNRHSNGVSFTNQGLYLLDYCKKTLENYEILKLELKKIDSNVSGRINVHVSTVFAKYYLAPILKKFMTEYPDIKVNLKTCSSSTLTPESITNGQADIIIRRGNVATDLNKTILIEEPYGIASKQQVEFNELKDLTWIRYNLPGTIESDEIFWNWWKTISSNNSFDKIIQVNSIEASLDLVYQGLGWTMLPKTHMHNFKSLVFNPLIDNKGNKIKLRTAMLYKENPQNPIIKVFTSFVEQLI